MPRSYGPQLERLAAVAGAGRWIAIGGARAAGPMAGSARAADPVAGGARAADPMAGSARSASSVHLFDPAGKPHGSIEFDAPVYALAWLYDDLLVAGTARGRVVASAVGGGETRRLVDVDAHRGAVRAMAVDRMRKRLWSVGDDGVLAEYTLEVQGLRLRRRRALCEGALFAVAADSDDRLVAAAGADGRAHVVATDAGDEAAARALPLGDRWGDNALHSLAFTGDGRLAAGGADGSVRLVYLEGAPDEEDRSGDAAHAGPVRGLVFGPPLVDEADRPRPRRLFSAGADGNLKAWFLDTKRKPKAIALGSTVLTGLAWLEPPSEAGEAHAGGHLLIVDERRRLTILPLDALGEPTDDAVEVDGQLEKLSRDLRSSGERVRADAVRALGELPEDEARRSIERALARDGSADVRALAATTLGASGRRRSRPTLRAALDDRDENVRAAALASLERLEADSPLAAVRAGLHAGFADVRLASVRMLPDLRAASPLVPGLIADVLTDADPKVRVAALDGLHALEPDDPVEPTRIAVARGPVDVREAALERLARAGGLSSPDGIQLVESVLDDDEARTRGVAFALLVASRPRLLGVLRARDPHFDRALDALERGDAFLPPAGEADLDEADRQPLFAALASRHPDTALRGATHLARIGDGRAIGALLQLSREDDDTVRTLALDGLVVAARVFPGDDRVRARIEWMLDDPVERLRARAFDGMQALADADGRAALSLARLALGATRFDVRGRALPLLVEFGGDGRFAERSELRADAERLLSEALDDEHAQVRIEAFRTLWAWHRDDPQVALTSAVRSRHADVRKRVVEILAPREASWAEQMLIARVGDSAHEVGLAAYEALLKVEANETRTEIHLAALASPRPEVRALGCEACVRAEPGPLRARLYELVDDDSPVVHLKAIEAVDALVPDDPVPFARAFESVFYELRVKAAELLGRRRKSEGIAPMRALLTIPPTQFDRPSDPLRQRAAGAIADAGDPAAVPFLVTLLDDGDPIVRENAARGLATSIRGRDVGPLVDALAHADLPVRSWAAEGLARMGDTRAGPVLAGTLEHPHRPIREGAIIGLVALGPDGVRGLLQGLEDADRTLQDLALAVIVARDVVLARVGLAPDLLLVALAASHSEIRFAAAKVLQTRDATSQLNEVARALVGPVVPDKAADTKDWPPAGAQAALLNVLVSALASDDPTQRYAAARVLSRRAQPKAFWREAQRLAGPSLGDQPWIPRTGWDEEVIQPRKRDWVRRLFRPVARPAEPESPKPDWVRRLFGRGDGPTTELFGTPPAASTGTSYHDDVVRLVFGTYAGLVRQAPIDGEADETHRVRRDSIAELSRLARDPAIGTTAVLPIFRRALSDPHHLVRKAAVQGLREVYPQGALEPLQLALRSPAADVGRAAVDELFEMAAGGDEQARDRALWAIDAPSKEVRAYALARLARLFAPGSLEPWFLALKSRFTDVRLAVVDRLVDARDERVAEALGRALESDHEDLRLKAALALAKVGDLRTLDVLAGFLRSEDRRVSQDALSALVGLGRDDARSAAAAKAALVISARLEDDPDRTADRAACLEALGRLGNVAGVPTLVAMVGDDDEPTRKAAFAALVALATERASGPRVYPDGARRARYREEVLLAFAGDVVTSTDETIRVDLAGVLADVDDPRAEGLLARMLEDRSPTVRAAAAEQLATRIRYVDDASTAPLERALRSERRELVLPAARGLAERRKPEAFQPLMLVFKAGTDDERRRAVFGLGTLGDPRALEELQRLVDGDADVSEDDRRLAPAAAEAFGALLSRLTDPAAQSRAREMLERLSIEGRPEVRLGALVGLRRAGDAPSRAVLERIAGDRVESSALRRAAVGELGRLGAVESESALADLLDDGDRRLRHDALAALRKILPEQRTSLLALQSRHVDIAEPAAQFLARRGAPEVLVERMPEIRDAPVRRRLRRGLIRRRAYAPKGLPPLLSSERPELRAEAAWLAGASREPSLAAPLLAAATTAEARWRRKRAALQDDRAVRAEEDAWLAALWAAERVGADAGAAARSALDAALPHRVTTQALRFLRAYGRRGDADAIEPLLTSGGADVRRAAAAALAALAPERGATVLDGTPGRDPVAAAPLVDASWSEAGPRWLASASHRPFVLSHALGPARAGAALRLLIAAAKGEGDAATRGVAISALGRIGGDDAEACLTQLLARDDEADAVRASAFKALRRAQRSRAVRYEEGQDQARGRARGAAGSDLEAAAEDFDEDDDLEDLAGEDDDRDDDEEEKD